MSALTTAPSAPIPVPSRPTSLRAAWIPLTALCLAFFVEMVDNTIMTIALPSMGRDLGASTTELQWVTGAYSLVFGSLLLTAGTLADRFGRRRVLTVGLLAFGAVSALAPLIASAEQLIGVRALLGVAAACMAPVTMSLVFRLFDDEALRMRAISLIVVVGMSAMALGPVGAGAVLSSLSWRWLVLVNTPIAALAALGVFLGVPRDTAADLHRAPLDLPGSLLSMTALAAACYSLTSGVDRGWSSPTTLGCVALAVLAGILVVARERSAAHPMLDLGLLVNRTVRGSALAQLGAGAAQMAVMFLLVLHLHYGQGWSALAAGLGNLPFILTMLAASPLSDVATRRLGHRLTCSIAALLIVLGLLELAWAAPHGYWVMIPGIVVLTAGLRVITTVCAVALISAVPEDRTSLGTAINDVVGELGTSIGTALIGTIIAVTVATQLPEGVWSAAMSARLFHGERISFLVVAVLVALVAGYGCSTLTASRLTEDDDAALDPAAGLAVGAPNADAVPVRTAAVPA